MESDTPRKADGDFSFMTQRNSSMNATALKIQLDQLKGVDLGSARQNFVLIHATPAGTFADYGKPGNVADNFKVLAAAAAEAGLTGIFFDSECYLGDAWNPSQVCPEFCPTPCLPTAPHYSGPGCPDSCLVPCRAAANAAGETVMKSILSAWPEAQVLGTFGPWISTAESQQHVSFLPNWAKENPIIGSFVVGWMMALQQHRARPTSTHASKALVLDGAECYGFRNLTDVLKMKQWMKAGMADTDIVPPDLKQAYPSLETVSPGVYDFPGVYRGRGPGTPAMWESDLVASLTGMDPDGLTWAYSEKYDWFGLGMHATGKQPVPKAWLDATRAAMKRAHKSDDVVSVLDNATEMTLQVVTPCSKSTPLRQMSFEAAVTGAPAGTQWFQVVQTSGPRFSALPFWFPHDQSIPHDQSRTVRVKWWSEYSDRDDAAHASVDPAHSSDSKAPNVDSFTVTLSAWSGRSSTGGKWLANTSKPATIHYDKSYTALRWNLSASARAVPGSVRLTLTPANSFSASLELRAQTRYAWWFQYKYTGTSSNGAADFVEGSSGNPISRDALSFVERQPPNWDLSFSVPGVWFLGIFSTFSKGGPASPHQSFLGDGFPSQRAPLAKGDDGTELFQPFAIVIPFANGTAPPLPKDFWGGHIRLAPIPGDARLALHPTGDNPFTTVTMFDGGTIALRLFFPGGGCGSLTLAQFIEIELPTCITLANASRSEEYTYIVVHEVNEALTTESDDSYRVRLIPQTPGHWSFCEESVMIWPTITCDVPSTTTINIRPVVGPVFNSTNENTGSQWQKLVVNVAAPPVALKSPPRRLAPSLTWADTSHFSPNQTAAGITNSIAMFRAVGMTTIPALGAQYHNPRFSPDFCSCSNIEKAWSTFLSCPAARISDMWW